MSEDIRDTGTVPYNLLLVINQSERLNYQMGCWPSKPESLFEVSFSCLFGSSFWVKSDLYVCVSKT